ncbi:hypothetical protein RirG_122630 [Rhizophagus irregularis DAOM 197198w]|uniref:Uncharacterized protein n=1 Tax=Rhizophagus irregularis (strain DAOM 197198w) TaxID=1432141 RepID=A0A015JAL9_RHIIW|nr:hypothetical protein RirG_122630 [Rhizophagus irregularis DAOM 197198w]
MHHNNISPKVHIRHSVTIPDFLGKHLFWKFFATSNRVVDILMKNLHKRVAELPVVS